MFKEAMTKALHSMSGLEKEDTETTNMHVGKLSKAIQQFQERVMELKIQVVSRTLQ